VLGLMQHRGVPTRFFVWTHSAFVALYFALEEPPQATPLQGKVSDAFA
jgi:hypothetical protein